jgi:polyhydroxybutyrate depolymerase
VDGKTRSYQVHVPESYTGETPVPLVLDFHGLMENPNWQKNHSGFRKLSNENGFIVAWPKGINNAWNFGPCCTQSRKVDDVAFAVAIVNKLKKMGCIDSKRVYATGYSNGGGISHHLACKAADVFAAVAPAAFDLVTVDNTEESIKGKVVDCVPSRPITVVSFRGKNDPIVPYEGGRSTPPTTYDLDPIYFLGAENTFKKWSEINGCSDLPKASYVDGKYTCKTYSECKEGVEVTLCYSNADMGHMQVNPDLAWRVLKAHPMP